MDSKVKREMANMGPGEVSQFVDLLGKSLQAVVPTDAKFILVVIPPEGCGLDAQFVSNQLSGVASADELRGLADQLDRIADSIQ